MYPFGINYASEKCAFQTGTVLPDLYWTQQPRVTASKRLTQNFQGAPFSSLLKVRGRHFERCSAGGPRVRGQFAERSQFAGQVVEWARGKRRLRR